MPCTLVRSTSDGKPSSDYAEDAIWLKSHWGLSCNLSSINQPDTSNLHPQPWGWSEDARRQFSSAGIADINLPSDETIATLRRLSHRRSSIVILQELDIDNLLPEEAPMRFQPYGIFGII